MKQVNSSDQTIDRILGYDLARSLAILGMILVHFSLVMAESLDQPSWLGTIVGFLDGRAAATFMILAGVGVTLRSRQVVRNADSQAIGRERRTLMARGFLLLTFGYINLLIIDWQGDILRVYGVSLLLAAWILTVTSRQLLAVSAVFVAGFLLLLSIVNFETNWDWATLTYRNLRTPVGTIRNLFYDGFRSVFPWTGFLVFGMWLGRLNLRDRIVSNRIIAAGLAVALSAEILSALLVSYFLAHPGAMDSETIVALFGTQSLPPLPLFLLASGGTAVAAIALSVRISDAVASAWWLRALASTGQMALTWYFAHIVLGLGTIEAMGWIGNQTLPMAVGAGVGFFAAAVLVSSLWKNRFRHGPLEWMMRRVAG